MKTYIEMEKLTPKRLWKFPQKRFGALVGPFSRFFGFSRFPGSVATLFFVGGGARGVQAFDPPPWPAPRFPLDRSITYGREYTCHSGGVNFGLPFVTS